MAITNGIKKINAAEIAKLNSNNVIENMEIVHSADAGTETTIDVTGFSGLYVVANDTMKYSIDGGTTYNDFEYDSAKREYLNMTPELTEVKVKNDNSSTSFVIFKG